VDVEHPFCWDIQHFLAKDLPVGYGYYDFGSEGSELSHSVTIPQGFRLQDRNAEILGG
jgi:hypothetical protein